MSTVFSPIPGVAGTPASAFDTHAQAPTGAQSKRSRIVSVDALRGFVMLLMLVDHTREFFYYPMQVSDPMALPATPPSLFLTRLIRSLRSEGERVSTILRNYPDFPGFIRFSPAQA